MPRPIPLLLTGAALGLTAGFATFAFAHGVRRAAFNIQNGPRRMDLLVEDSGPGWVRLRPRVRRPATGWDVDALFGLQWPGGYGQVGPAISREARSVVRAYIPLEGGTPPPGTLARVDTFAFPADPLGRGIDFTEVHVPGDVGVLPAWHIAGEGDTWAIFVHGKGAWRGEALRVLPLVREFGLPGLAITYRGDAGIEGDSTLHYAYGHHEWRDLEAAVQHALNAGARRVVLFGYSMGGSISMSFLKHSELRDRVAALVLDAPMLDFAETLRFRLAAGRIPKPVRALILALVRATSPVDWHALDYTRETAYLTVPTLLVHGDRDATVPVTTSDRLARLRPDVVEYARLEGAGHVHGWNVGPEAYEDRLRAFLQAHVNAGSPAGG
ncbi:MAG: alpha/beta fold hydrolase [Dehalococcoidia bacterium]|nr:alpha/beta fold hydrolase [Dehalococcoidia bacterium]